MCNVHFILTLTPPWLQVKVTKYFDFVNLDIWRVVVCVHFSSETTQPISPMMMPINLGNSVDVQRALHFDLDPSMTGGQGRKILRFWEFRCLTGSSLCKHLNSKNRSILWPWPAVMEGSRSKWSARCTSTLFPKLIGIIIGEIGWVVSEEKRTQTTTRQTSKFTKSKYFVTLTCSHGGVKVKMKCTLHIYIVPSVDWYHHWRNRSSSFVGEANTNCYPSNI